MNGFQHGPFSPRRFSLAQGILVPPAVVPAPALAVVPATTVPSVMKLALGGGLVALGGYGMTRWSKKTSMGQVTSWMPVAALLGGLWIGAEGLGVGL